MSEPNLTPLRAKRLSKSDRRRQLLDVAREMLRCDGAEGLTLATLAARAGVSKPVAYDHFETRSGLLIAMLEDTSRYYESDAEAKIAQAPATVPAIAAIVAEAYVQCAISAGPAMTVLAAAAAADTDARDTGRAMQRDHAASFQQAFAPILAPGSMPLEPLYKGLVAAANALCDECMQDDMSAADAIEMLTHLLVTSLTPFALTRH